MPRVSRHFLPGHGNYTQCEDSKGYGNDFGSESHALTPEHHPLGGKA
jgi:hypothetical protein